MVSSAENQRKKEEYREKNRVAVQAAKEAENLPIETLVAWNDSLTALSVGIRWLETLIKEQDEVLKEAPDTDKDKDVIARNEMMSFVVFSLANEVRTLGY